MYFEVYSQVKSTSLKTVNIIQPRDFYLNSQMRTDLLGGTQTHVVRVQLPPNTIEWYYAFSVSSTENDRASLSLTTQLASIIDKTGLASVALSALYTPTGSYACNVYLLANSGSAQTFANGNSDWRHFSNYQLTSTRNGVNVVKDRQFLSGTWYVGFKNLLETQGINVTVEVVAVVEETEVDGSEWDKEIVDEMYNQILEPIKKAFGNERGEKIANCVMDKLQENYVPNDFKNMPEYKRKKVLQEIGGECEKGN